jgi:hypothetical protein
LEEIKMSKMFLVSGIILMLISTSIVSSMDNIAKDISADSNQSEFLYNSEGRFSHNTTWYMFINNGPNGTGFYAYYPNNTMRFREWEGPGFFSAGTWTNDGRFLCCLYVNGGLYDIDPETLNASYIGGGGDSLNGLAYNPVDEKLYGASSSTLFEINMTTGAQSYIGSFGIVNSIIAIAFDIDGICYGWDVKFSGESYLYKINISTGKATIVGGMGYNLVYAQDGSFDYDTDILYLAAYIASPPTGSWLLECDEDTGACTIIDSLIGETTVFAISYEIDKEPPITNISFDPPEPDGCNDWYVSNVEVTLIAEDESGADATYYRINEGIWETYESPFIITEDGKDILIKYYSVDIEGNQEDIKSATLDIDKTPPNISVEWTVEKLGWFMRRVYFNIIISDNTSGLDRLEIYIDDGLQAVITGPGPVIGWNFNLPYGSDFNFKFIAWDNACNQATVVVNSSDITVINKEKSSENQHPFYFYFQEILKNFPFIQRLFEMMEAILC